MSVSDRQLVVVEDKSPIGIICGGGSLPFAIADSVLRNGRRVVLLAIKGWADAGRVAQYPHHWIALGQFGHLCRLARSEGCRDLVFIGSLLRPRVTQIRLDLLTVRIIPKIISAFRGGDDHLLSGIARIFEQYGFRLLGAHEVAPDILAPAGALGQRRPSDDDLADMQRAVALLTSIGPFDVGQAVVIAGGHVLAVEAAEGTDLMLERVADLRKRGRVASPAGVGVLVKAPKKGQDLRFDMPAIGPATVDGVVRAGLAGVAVMAGATLIADAMDVAQRADGNGIFVYGVAGETAAS